MGEFSEFFSSIGVLGLGIYILGASIRSRRVKAARWDARLLHVAKVHGLRLVSARGASQLAGTIEGFQVEVQTMKSRQRLQVVITGGPLEPLAQLSFHSERGTMFFPKASSDPQVGDFAFDRAVKLDLPEVDPGFAMLSSALRQDLQRTTRAGGFFADGRLVVRGRPLMGQIQLDWNAFSEEEISELIEQAMTTARLLQQAHESPIDTLLDTAKNDPNGDIRFRAVRLLDELHGDSKAAQLALLDLQTSDDQAVQLEACLRGNPRDYGTVRRIARDSLAPDSSRSRAIGGLPTDDLGRLRNTDRTMLTELTDIETFTVLEAILKKFVLTNHTPELALLQRAAKQTTDRGRLAAVRLAGRQNTPHFDWLVELLDSRYPISSVGAAQALGASGNPRATVHLQRLLTEHDTPTTLKRAARAALDLLRANLGHRGGGLSVTEHEDGRVSLVDAGEGALSRPVSTPKKQST